MLPGTRPFNRSWRLFERATVSGTLLVVSSSLLASPYQQSFNMTAGVELDTNPTMATRDEKTIYRQGKTKVIGKLPTVGQRVVVSAMEVEEGQTMTAACLPLAGWTK